MNDFVDLFPYKKDIQLTSIADKIRVLRLTDFFYKSLCASIEAFVAREYGKFDAHVGDSLCQIRAYRLILISENRDKEFIESLFKLTQEIKSLQMACQQLLQEYLVLRHKRTTRETQHIVQSMTLEMFLERQRFDIILTDIQIFLVQNFILSRYHCTLSLDPWPGKGGTKMTIYYSRFCEELKISSKSFMRKMIVYLQHNISKQSCHFIFQLSCELGINSYHIQLFKALYLKDGNGRHVIAGYEVTKAIMQHAFLTKKWIQLIVLRISEKVQEELYFMLKPAENNKDYVLTNMIADCPNHQALIVCKGVAHYETDINETKDQYIKRFLDIGYEDILLSNMAQHPQYVDQQLSAHRDNPYLQLRDKLIEQQHMDYVTRAEDQFLQHKYLSKKIGCAQSNASLFLLTHISCDSVIHLMERQVAEKQELENA